MTSKTRKTLRLAFFTIGIALLPYSVTAQNKHTIEGVLLSQQSATPIAYATVALFSLPDTTLQCGTTSDSSGHFSLKSHPGKKTCLLRVTHIGYRTEIRTITLQNTPRLNLGIIVLSNATNTINEVSIRGTSIAIKETGSSVFYKLSRNVRQTAQSGTDVLRHIPGVQIDFMQNFTLEGKGNIAIYVDGRERDLSYIRQLSPNNIKSVEVQSTPDAKYGIEHQGVINIITKEGQAGLSGSVHVEIPTNKNETYLFPTYTISFAHKKISAFTAYNGDIKRLTLDEQYKNSITQQSDTFIYLQKQQSIQHDGIHRFSYGLDYHASTSDILGIYGYASSYSQEFEGNMLIKTVNQKTVIDSITGKQKDKDQNSQLFTSIFYEHKLQKGGSITTEASIFNLSAHRSSMLTPNSLFPPEKNETDPNQQSLQLKLDITLPVTPKLTLSAGVRGAHSQLSDSKNPAFDHKEANLSAYSKASYSTARLSLNTGIRVEYQDIEMKGYFRRHKIYLSPNISVSYKINDKQSIRLTAKQSSQHPSLYLLNPSTTADGYFATRTGNPDLKSETLYNLSLSHSIRIGQGSATTQLFVQKKAQAVGFLTSVDHLKHLTSYAYNLGSIYQVGMQVSGTLQVGSSLSLNPFIKLFKVRTTLNSWVRKQELYGRDDLSIETGLSAALSLNRGWALAFIIQYNTPQIGIANETFSDALYFVSITKNIKEKLSIGISSGMPFARSFTCNGKREQQKDFQKEYEGVLKLSAVPLLFKISYSFSAGRKVNEQNREAEPYKHDSQRGF